MPQQPYSDETICPIKLAFLDEPQKDHALADITNLIK